MIECFVETFVVVEFTDLDSWTGDDVSTKTFEQFSEFLSLRRRTRNDNRSSFQRFRHCSSVPAPRSINDDAREAPISSALSGGPDNESCNLLEPSGRAT